MSSIIKFWKENPQMWITHPSKYDEVDKIICSKFWEFEWWYENTIGQIVYLDQFSRHFNRQGLITNEDVFINRILATHKVSAVIYELVEMDEVEIVFALMPFKHLGDYEFIFNYLHNVWIPTNKHKNKTYKVLSRFYKDTYKKAFTQELIKSEIVYEHKLEPFDEMQICEYYPNNSPDWSKISKYDEILNKLDYKEPILVSLSGGVDSMVLLSLLKYKGIDVRAVHIIYGNRSESEQEYNFLVEFCMKLGVRLAVYRIKWLCRDTIERQFYEDMTREIRFAVYRAVMDKECNKSIPIVVLGHIRNDIVENIWTNIAHCQHLGNLKKMELMELQNGVRIMRPFISIDKCIIYNIANDLAIPYLRNTTPSWSNRGKFREKFHNATVAQFGETIDNKIIEFAEYIRLQNTHLQILLYEPIYRSFTNNTIDITPAVKINLDVTGWIHIFDEVCHRKLGIHKPSIHSVKNFCKRLQSFVLDRKITITTINIHKHLQVEIIKSDSVSFYVRFILV